MPYCLTALSSLELLHGCLDPPGLTTFLRLSLLFPLLGNCGREVETLLALLTVSMVLALFFRALDSTFEQSFSILSQQLYDIRGSRHYLGHFLLKTQRTSRQN